MDTDSPPTAAFEIHVGAHGGPILRVEAGGRSIPIAVAPDQAAALGVAMISASALFSPGQEPPSSGETITGSNLPVTGWQVGANVRSGEPAVLISLQGGANLVLQFTRQSAMACARLLQALATDPEQHAEAGESGLPNTR